MSVIGEFSVPASAVAMQRTLAAIPEMTVELERVVAHRSECLVPYMWVRGGDKERFRSAIEADPSVREATPLDVHDGETLYRTEWSPDVESACHAYLQAGATLLEAKGSNRRWELRLRFDSHQDVSTFHAYCDDHDISVEVNRIHDPADPMTARPSGITTKQREALDAALEAGLYDVPQSATMSDVADRLGISQQAVSKRLHRGHGTLVETVLTVEEFFPG